MAGNSIPGQGIACYPAARGYGKKMYGLPVACLAATPPVV
jgi:hypothetical protein